MTKIGSWNQVLRRFFCTSDFPMYARWGRDRGREGSLMSTRLLQYITDNVELKNLDSMSHLYLLCKTSCFSMVKKCQRLSKSKSSAATTFKRAKTMMQLISNNNELMSGSEGGLPPTTHLVLPLYRLLALLEQVHLSFLRGQVTVLLTVWSVECPQKVHTIQTLTLRIIQLKLIRKNVVQQ